MLELRPPDPIADYKAPLMLPIGNQDSRCCRPLRGRLGKALVTPRVDSFFMIALKGGRRCARHDKGSVSLGTAQIEQTLAAAVDMILIESSAGNA
jgi:hypothetical protein